MLSLLMEGDGRKMIKGETQVKKTTANDLQKLTSKVTSVKTPKYTLTNPNGVTDNGESTQVDLLHQKVKPSIERMSCNVLSH